MNEIETTKPKQKPPLRQRLEDWFHRAKIYLIFAQRHHPNLFYLWCFLLPAAIMTFCHACLGVFPFGKMSVLTLDLNAQYVFFFEALRDWVWGEGSLLYTFSRSLGGEFLGIYAYYLASPLSYIVAIFPKQNITEAIFLMLILRCGLSGLTFAYFLRKKDNMPLLYTLLFSTTYALIGYATVMQHNVMWFDNVILLPLIVLGLYELIVHRKYKMYTLSLALAILSNFYIGYMTCIFVALYSAFLYLSLTPNRRNPKGEFAHLPRAILRVALFSIIAILIAALIILPAAYALSFGKNEFTNPNFNFQGRFPILDLLKQFLFCSYDTVRPEGLPIVYSGILTLMLLPVYFACRRIRMRERLCHGLFALLLLACFSINTIDMIWHGFQAPNWLNYRYSYMLCFILVYMAARAIPHLSLVSKKEILTITVSFLFLIVFISFYRYKTVYALSTLLGSVLFVVIYGVLMYKWVTPKSKHKQKWLKKVVLMVVCLELTINSIYDLCMLWYDVGMADRASYVDYLAEWQPIIDDVKESDTDFYRMEKLPYRRMNDPAAFGFRGLTASTSTLHAGAIAFIEVMGISADSHWSEYAGSSPVTDSILGIRYVIDSVGKNRVSTTYEVYKNDGAHLAYYNPYALPIAFCVSDKVNDISFSAKPSGEEAEEGKTYYSKMHSAFERMNYLLGAMMGEDAPVDVYLPFEALKKEVDTHLGTAHYSYDYYYLPSFTEGDKGDITFTLGGSEGREIFAYFPSDYQREGNKLTVEGQETVPWFDNSNFGTVYIGEIEGGAQKTVTITVAGKDGLYVTAVDGTNLKSYFYTLNEELYRSVFAELQEGGIRLDSFTEDSFHGSITVPEDRTTVFTTIPYDEGWKVTVDGEAVEIYETMDALVAFDLTPGEHTIDMEYRPEIYGTALKLCAVGVASFTLIVAGEYVYGILRRKYASKQN